MKESYYESAIKKIHEFQASGLPFVLVGIERNYDFEDDSEGERICVFGGTNSVFEAQGMLQAGLDFVERCG